MAAAAAVRRPRMAVIHHMSHLALGQYAKPEREGPAPFNHASLDESPLSLDGRLHRRRWRLVRRLPSFLSYLPSTTGTSERAVRTTARIP